MFYPSADKNLPTVALIFALLLSLPLMVAAQDETGPSLDLAIELFNRGQDAHAKGELANAIELYDKALSLLPEFAEAEFQKGNAYLTLGKVPEAEKAFRHAVELRGEWTLALAALGTTVLRRGEFSEAEKLLTKAISLDAGSFPAYSGLVELRIRTKASPEVLKLLLEKVSTFNTRPNATAASFAAQASLENAVGDRPAAKRSLTRALALEPANRNALYTRAEIAVGEGDLVLADEVIKLIEKSDGASEDARLVRARYFIGAGRYDEAGKILAAVERPSTETLRLAEKVKLSAVQSTEILEKALEKDQKDVFVLGKLCSGYRVSAPDKALGYCKRALEVEPGNINFAIGFGAALLQAKRYEEAIVVLRRLLELSPENATIHANLGTALFQAKRYQEAKLEYQWLTSRSPTPPIAFYFLAICHDQLGELLDAGANYNLFLKNADPSKNQLEIDKVKLRLPILERDLKRRGGKSNNKGGQAK